MSSHKIVPRVRTGTEILVKIDRIPLCAEHSNTGVMSSCISCMCFNERDELCNNKKATAVPARPPARVIAFGCQFYEDNNDIPF